MKAMRLADSGAAPTLIEEDIPRPLPGRGELLIRVYAAGVTSNELLWYPTTHDKNGEIRRRAVPGHEFSGVVAALGEDADRFAVGQEIYGMNDWFADGATAEFCITQPANIASKPVTLTHIEAASIPISGLTAWQGLFEHAKLQAGEQVLVHGGAGGVGLFAIQLARFAGARVTTTASSRNYEFVMKLGAERVIDYRAMSFEKQVAEVDVVFDTVGGETLRRSWSVLKPGGRMITVAADSETKIDERIKQSFFIVEANGEQLSRIGRMLDAGDLRTEVDAIIPLHRAAEAYAGMVKERHGRGKLVISVAAPESRRKEPGRELNQSRGTRCHT
jgi:NADPH:quinone reductase-like Zn-dependent oxidoreductase